MLGFIALEVLLRIKNNSMRNYDIEMWRYSRELKVRTDNRALGHLHGKDRSAILESVVIRTNAWGLRGPPISRSRTTDRRILFLGGSIALGWGVPEEETVTARVQRNLEARGEKVEVLNGGVGNYNAERYVERFFVELAELEPTDIVVQYFLRDAEFLNAGRDSFILRNSQVAVTTWIAASRLFGKVGATSLRDHYLAAYAPSQLGYNTMRQSLERLARYARANNIRLYMAMTPDVHDLGDYQFGFVHDRMKAIASEFGYAYVDLLSAFGTLTPSDIWVMPGDPHPNGLGHKLMADALTPVLALSK
jgi:lysophospholipase L1-like esterase